MTTRPFLLVAPLLLAACDARGSADAPKPAHNPAEAPGQTKSDPDAPLPDRDPALAHRLVEHEGAVLLDVRTLAEYDAGHIDGAANISHDELARRISEVETLTGGDRSKPIVVYCRSGNRSGQAKTVLTEAGYPRVTNLGGMSDW